MQKKGFAVATFLILVFCTSSQSQVVLPDSTVTLLKAAVEGFQNRYHSPSIVVAIVHDKKIIFSEARGYTDQENKIPASIDSKSPVLSVTKIFTATMLMQLKQRNVVKLEDDVKTLCLNSLLLTVDETTPGQPFSNWRHILPACHVIHKPISISPNKSTDGCLQELIIPQSS